MSDAQHADRLAVLLELEGRVGLSGYATELYHDTLQGWQSFQTKARISAGRGTALRTECVWINPTCAAALDRREGLFAGDAA